MKDPIGNFGVVMGEVTKRGKLTLGISQGNPLAGHVHPNLSLAAQQVSKNTEMFGNAVEKLLIKYSKCFMFLSYADYIFLFDTGAQFTYDFLSKDIKMRALACITLCKTNLLC